jgi:predicted transglutaminase-like cysteine proteinase
VETTDWTRTSSEQVEMTHSTHDLKIVNTKVNLLPYRAEVEEDWSPAIDGGDCDSYATAKMQRLIQYGWPERSLRLACCFVEPSHAAEKRNRYHLVLLADLDGETWVLDNRYPFPMRHGDLNYEWHKLWNHDLNAWEWAVGADKSFS